MNDSSLYIVLQRMRLPFIVILITYSIAITGLILIPGEDLEGNVYYMSIFDAFYFVTYTATTIGFGEIPYPFTYHQKIWVSISIYITVLGWFYGIGTLITLVQDKLFLSEIAITRFVRSVKNMKEDFVIVLGYNEITREIINRMLAAKMRVVVIEINKQRADYLRLEGFTPHVPILVKDAHNPQALVDAGIQLPNCKGIISLFKSNALNLRITLSSKLLNPYINVVVKSTSKEETKNLLDVGADIVDNPFVIISSYMQMALNAPSIFKLESWLYQTNNLESKTFSIPDNNIIICGYGSLGSSLYEMFKNNNVIPTVIEIDETKVATAKHLGIYSIIHGDADNHLCLDEANIQEAKLIIIATDNDTTNLSILSTIKRVNAKAIVVAIENEITDFSIFSHAKIDQLYIPQRILIHKITNAISNPLSDMMIEIVINKDEQWGQKLLLKLMKTIGINPIAYELNITKEESIEIYKYLQDKNETLELGTLKASRRDRNQNNNIVTLLIKRGDEEILLPEDSTHIQVNDKILLACDSNAIEDLEYIANNIYEFQYVITGKEKKLFFR